MIDYIKKLFVASVLVIAFVLPTQVSAAIPGTDIELSGDKQLLHDLKAPAVSVEIPGLKFSTIDEIVKNKTTGKLPGGRTGEFLVIPFLGQYISAIYKFAVIAAGIVSTLVIIVSGIQWTASAGNSSIVSSAKSRIVNAVIGLVIAVGSYSILFVLNPNLVNFENLKIFQVEAEEFTLEQEAEAGSKGDPAEAQTINSTIEGLTSHDEKTVRAYAKTNKLFCTPKIKSTKAIYSGVSINYSQLGRLDCNQAKSSRRPIKKIVLHEGLNNNQVSAMATMWRRNIIGYDKVCKKNSKGKWNNKKCNTEGQLVRIKKYAGTHYTVDGDGTIYQMAGENLVMMHCGGTKGQVSCNRDSIGIDLMLNKIGGKYPRYTEAQYKSLSKLLVALATKYKINIDDTTIHGHADCQANRFDPRNLDWDKLGELTGGNLNNEKHPKTQAPFKQSPYSCN